MDNKQQMMQSLMSMVQQKQKAQTQKSKQKKQIIKEKQKTNVFTTYLVQQENNKKSKTGKMDLSVISAEQSTGDVSLEKLRQRDKTLVAVFFMDLGNQKIHLTKIHQDDDLDQLAQHICLSNCLGSDQHLSLKNKLVAYVHQYMIDQDLKINYHQTPIYQEQDVPVLDRQRHSSILNNILHKAYNNTPHHQYTHNIQQSPLQYTTTTTTNNNNNNMQQCNTYNNTNYIDTIQESKAIDKQIPNNNMNSRFFMNSKYINRTMKTEQSDNSPMNLSDNCIKTKCYDANSTYLHKLVKNAIISNTVQRSNSNNASPKVISNTNRNKNTNIKHNNSPTNNNYYNNNTGYKQNPYNKWKCTQQTFGNYLSKQTEEPSINNMSSQNTYTSKQDSSDQASLDAFYLRLQLDTCKPLSQQNTRLSQLTSGDLEVYQILYKYLEQPITSYTLYNRLSLDGKAAKVIQMITRNTQNNYYENNQHSQLITDIRNKMTTPRKNQQKKSNFDMLNQSRSQKTLFKQF